MEKIQLKCFKNKNSKYQVPKKENLGKIFMIITERKNQIT